MLNLLVVDDNPDDAELLLLELRRAGIPFSHTIAGSFSEVGPLLEGGPWSAVISDYNLGDRTGLDVLRLVREQLGDVPFLIVSGTIGEEAAAEIIREGADEYVMKDRPARLSGAVRRAVEAAVQRAEHRQLEERIRQMEARYRKTFENAPLGIITADRDGIVLAVNERFCQIVQRDSEDIVGRAVEELVAPDHREGHRNTYRKLLEGFMPPEAYERRWLRPDGTDVWTRLTASVVRGADGTVEYALAHVADVSEERAAREALHLQSNLLQCVQQAVIATDLEGRVTYWNRHAEEMYGWSAEEATGNLVTKLTTTSMSQAEASEILRSLQRGESWSGEFELGRRDGSTFPGYVLDAPLYDAGGSLTGVVGVSFDISERRRSEQTLRENRLQLAEAQRLAKVGSWTYDLESGEREISLGLFELLGLDPAVPIDVAAILDSIHPDDRAGVEQVLAAAHGGQLEGETEFRMTLRARERNFTGRFRTMFDERGSPAKRLAILQDVTELKAIEQDLRRRSVQQASVANLGQMALSGASLDFLLKQATHAVRTMFEVDRGEIVRKSPDGLLLIAASGDEHFEPALLSPDSDQLARFAMDQGHPILISDLATETRFVPPQRLLDEGMTGGIALPITGGDGEPWGVLAALSREPRGFSHSEVDFFRSVAAVLAQAIDRATADDFLRVRAIQQNAIARLGRLLLTSLDDDVFDRVCALVTQATGASAAFIHELTERGTLLLRSGDPTAAGPVERPLSASDIAGAAAVSGEPLVIADCQLEQRLGRHFEEPPDVRSGVSIPIASGSRTYGVLSARAMNIGSFSEEDVDFIQSLANMLAEAIEREQTRRAVAESEQRYQRIFNGAQEIIFSVDREGRFVTLNRAFEEITGHRASDWIGHSFTEILAPHHRERNFLIFEQMLAEKRAASAEMILLGVERDVWVEVFSFPQFEEDEVTEVYGFAADVTERRNAERERERVTRDLQLVLESTLEGIFTISASGICTVINAAAARMLGHDPASLIGLPLRRVLNGDPLAPCPDEQRILGIIAGGSPVTVASGTFRRTDGSSIPVSYSAAPIIDNGATVGVVVTFTDLSERRKLETKLEQANRLSSLGRLAATVAHEFNNVLMGISPFVEVLRRNPTPARMETALEHITNSVKRGRRITEDILRFTQPAQPVLETVDLNPWASDLAAESRSVVTAAHRVEVDVEPLTVRADGSQLHQIFMNLILNARDAMPDGGTITIRARRETAGSKFGFGAVANVERYAHLSVTDTGTGIDPDALQFIFEPLFTTKRSGTGLGLPVTQQVVTRHNGEIFVESRLGAGTSFHVFIPLAAQAQPEPASLPEALVTHSHPVAHKVLLVEDDLNVAAGLEALLDFEGFEVALARSGAEAIEIAANLRPDVVLLDVGLPDMEGTAVYEKLVSLHPDVPVIFSTGHADRGQLEDLLARPTVRYLLKPYDANVLMETLSELLGSRRNGA